MLGDPRRPAGTSTAQPSASGGAPRVPQIAPRRPQSPQQQQRAAGRDPLQPYINHGASAASHAKHMLIGIDKTKLETTVKTHELVALLEHVITGGFGGPASEKMAADLKSMYDSAVAANEKSATEGQQP